jgi:hypothetical protein
LSGTFDVSKCQSCRPEGQPKISQQSDRGVEELSAAETGGINQENKRELDGKVQQIRRIR